MRYKSSLEDIDNSSHELLIDKVIRQNKEPKSPISLTVDILKQREEIKKELIDKLNSKDSTKDEEDDTLDEDMSTKEDTSTKDESDNIEEDKPKDEADNKEDTKDNKDEVNDTSNSTSTEAFKVYLKLSNLFSPIEEYKNSYMLSLEEYNLSNKSVDIDKQPIAYVKDSIIKSLNNLIDVADIYINNNKKVVENISSTVKSLNERLTVFSTFVEKGKYSFTNKVVNDKDILSNLCTSSKSEIRDTLRILTKYIDKSNNAINLILNNEFNNIKNYFFNSDFTLNDSDLEYKEMLPGFNLIRAHIEPYKNYLKTKIKDNQYYSIRVFKAEDLFNLDPIVINEETDLKFIMAGLNKLLANIIVSTENLSTMNLHFTTFIDEIKVIIFDIDKEKYDNFSSIDIDSKIKNFIKFKLAIECYNCNINLMIDYLTSVITSLNESIELRD